MSIKTMLWLDTETTGLNPKVNDVLEVGAVVTDGSGHVIDKFALTIEPPYDGWVEGMAREVQDMHARSGLIDDVNRSPYALADAEAGIIGMLLRAGAERGRVVLAGSGVAHFDVHVVNHQMPNLFRWLHYRTFEVSSLRTAMRLAGRGDLVAAGGTYDGDALGDKPHRALADILDHLNEWHAYREMLARL